MKTLSLATVAASLALAGAAMAQPVQSPAADPAVVSTSAAHAVGRWLYDVQGNTIGSVRTLADGGRSVVIMLGSYFQPGCHAVTVPARRLSIVDGKVTLLTETVEALNTTAR